MPRFSQNYLISLVQELRKLPSETEWLEFKLNKDDPEMIGQRISALSNSAALVGKNTAYLIWGIDDQTHDIKGTHFDYRTKKIGNEELENWLLHSISPKIHFKFHSIRIDDHSIVILEIPRAEHSPVQFQSKAYIRIGSYTKELKNNPDRERQLWRIFDQTPFEKLPARQNVGDQEILQLLDYPSYFELMEADLPSNRAKILSRLKDESFIMKNDSGSWDILNLGAILFARKLSSFEKLSRKALRVIHYKGNSRLETLHEQVGNKGYACGFEGLIDSINARIPHHEVLGTALRKNVPMFPEIAIRELVANALIHQDLFQTGTGPMIEIFDDRLEISNPGIPLIDTDRFLDSPPKSRNEALASIMRRVGICEERGSGIDKVVTQTEVFQLPAPCFETTPEHTRSVLFAHKDFESMGMIERVHACYMHACLKYLMHDYMTNESLRVRFGISSNKISSVSRVISAAKKKNLIVPAEEGQGNKFARYLPHWTR